MGARDALLGADVHPVHDRMAQDPQICNSPCPSTHPSQVALGHPGIFQ